MFTLLLDIIIRGLHSTSDLGVLGGGGGGGGVGQSASGKGIPGTPQITNVLETGPQKRGVPISLLHQSI